MTHRLYCFFMALIILTSACYGDDTSIKAEIDSAYALEEGKGIITITHDARQKIDVTSFRLDKKPLLVEYIKNVPLFTNSYEIVIYRFTVPSQPEGLYVLPSISVNIGSKEYRTIMSSYHVSQKREIPKDTKNNNQAINHQSNEIITSPELHLEASVDGPTTLYPGQRTKLIYHYYYKGLIELVTEHLPLLDSKGFTKIGEKEIKDYVVDTLSVSEISQVIEAIKPGKFSFGPSLIEGYGYRDDGSGNHRRTSSKITSEAPEIIITVLPFPETNQPNSFNGAVGHQLQFSTALLGKNELSLGDVISFQITITGISKQVPLPEVCCQPGFIGFFRMTDLPPMISINGNTERAKLQIRPLTADIQAIPILEFTYFDPEKTTYITLKSSPIPIIIDPPLSNDSPLKEVSSQTLNTHPQENAIEELMRLQSTDLYNKPLGNWWVFMSIPLGTILIIYQIKLRRHLIEASILKNSMNEFKLLELALKEPTYSAAYFNGISHALKYALLKAGMITSMDISTDQLPQDDISGEVRIFLLKLDEYHYLGKVKQENSNINQSAKELLEKIDRGLS